MMCARMTVKGSLQLLAFSVTMGMVLCSPHVPPEVDTGKKYGDPCETNQYCHGELVSCHAGLCSCFTPEEMVYDEFTLGCKVLAGKTCELNWKVSVNCVEGAYCDEASGVCLCEDGFYPAENGTCTRKKLFKESCTTDGECYGSATKSLVCHEGVCQCDKRGQVYDAERKSCVSVVDAECLSEDEEFECTSRAVCRQGRCSCRHPYAKSASGKCELGYRQECNTGQICADIYFSCINGRCDCKASLHQVFDERTQECVSLVFGPCTFPKNTFKTNVTGIYDIQKCTKNALCVDKGFYSECECKDRYVQTKAGTCAPGFGETCEVDECDPITPLVCRDQVCQCGDYMQTYDPTIKKCVGLVGSRCTRDKPNCVEFASCVIPESEIAGQCICDKYSMEIANRTCVISV